MGPTGEESWDEAPSPRAVALGLTPAEALHLAVVQLGT